MLALMLAEANHALEKLDVPGWQPVTMSDVVNFNISPPRMRVGGSIDTANYYFGFGENKLQFIQRVEPDSEMNLAERQLRWSRMKSPTGTNEAFQLATNWLIRLDVDVDELQKSHPVTVQQQFFFPAGDTKHTPVMLPRFEVRWGTNQSRPAVWVSIFGPTKSPLHIRQEDGSFIRRPNLVNKEKIEHLLAIENKDFAAWTIGEKSNVVTQSAGNAYSSLAFPDIQSASSFSRKQPLEAKKANAIGSESNKKTWTLKPATAPR